MLIKTVLLCLPGKGSPIHNLSSHQYGERCGVCVSKGKELLCMHAPQHQEDTCVSHSEGHSGLSFVCHRVILHLDYCDPHLAGPSACIIRHLKRIQKAVWWVNIAKFVHATPLKHTLHWLPFGCLNPIQVTGISLPCCKWLRPILTIGLPFPFYEWSPDAAQQNPDCWLIVATVIRIAETLTSVAD